MVHHTTESAKPVDPALRRASSPGGDDADAGRPFIVLEAATVEYPGRGAQAPTRALDAVDLEVQAGEFVSLVGPSGCGKTTLLMAVAGLLELTDGSVRIGGRQVVAPGPDRAVVFQEFALLPWRTVRRNVEFAFEGGELTRRQRRDRADEFLELVGLRDFADHYPAQLSGGMRQRVGIARALAIEPETLLMDEPFGALDAQTKVVLGEELLRLWERDRQTVLFVTHDIDEAIFLSDRIAVMSRRPASVRCLIDIDLPRPRPHDIKTAPEFNEYRQQIWNLLHDEAAEASREPN